MKLLLDECVPRKLKTYLSGMDCKTVPEAGLAGEKNGKLLRLAVISGFQVFLTVDQGIEYQQNLQPSGIAIVVVRARSDRLDDLRRYLPQVLNALSSIQPGEIVKVGHTGRD